MAIINGMEINKYLVDKTKIQIMDMLTPRKPWHSPDERVRDEVLRANTSRPQPSRHQNTLLLCDGVGMTEWGALFVCNCFIYGSTHNYARPGRIPDPRCCAVHLRSRTDESRDIYFIYPRCLPCAFPSYHYHCSCIGKNRTIRLVPGTQKKTHHT